MAKTTWRSIDLQSGSLKVRAASHIEITVRFFGMCGSSYRTSLHSCLFCSDWNVINGPHWFPFRGWCRISCLSALLSSSLSSYFTLLFFFHLIADRRLLCDCQPLLSFLHKNLLGRCCSSAYSVCVKLFIVALIFALCAFYPASPLCSPLLQGTVIVGNELHGLKVKHLHVGGVLGSGEVQNGIRGCIQVKMNQLNF